MSKDPTSNNGFSSNAMDAAGDSVVVWMSGSQDGSGYGVYAQRYDSSQAVVGSQFRVNTYTTNAQSFPKVAMDAAGDFVVTWQSTGQDGSADGIYAQRFNKTGAAVGSEFRVNTTTPGGQDAPAIAMDTVGDFVIAWDSSGQDGSGRGVYAQRYNSSGSTVGGEFQVNTYTTGDQFKPAIAMDSQGDFVATWTSVLQDGSGNGVFARRFNAAGAAQGNDFQVNTYTTGNQSAPSIAMDSAGDFTVVWESDGEDASSYGVFGECFLPSGVNFTPVFLVNTTTNEAQRSPRVAEDPAGDFIVTWESAGQDGSGYGVYAQSFTPSGTYNDFEFRVNTYTSSDQANPAVAMDASGDLIATWASYGQSGFANVYAQQYRQTPVGPIVTAVLDGRQVINPNDRLTSPFSTLTVDFSQDMDVSGGATGANSVLNPANWRIFRNGVSLPNDVASVTFGYNSMTNRYEATVYVNALDDGLYQLVAYPSIKSSVGGSLDGDANGVAGGNFNRSFFVVPSVSGTTDVQVNTNLTSRHESPAVASDASGDDVIVWSSYQQDGSGYGIYAQRYNAAGVAQGNEFRVNTTTQAHQAKPAVAMDAAGDFVVTWQGQGDNGILGYGIFAQRFNASGVAQGTEFRVNTFTANAQINPQVAMDQTGDFGITWQSNNQANPSSGYDIYLQRYNAAGIAQGSETRVNTFTTGAQIAPSIAMDPGGDFVVTWASNNERTASSGYDIYAQRFSSFGVALGSEIDVNIGSTGDQTLPSVAMDATGDFVVVFEDHYLGGTGSGETGCYARSFNRDGLMPSGEFLVVSDLNISPGQKVVESKPRLAMDLHGEYTITLQADNEDGSSYGIFAERYNPSQTPFTKQFQVNSTTANKQFAPAIAMDAKGDVIIAWVGEQTGTDEVYSQRYQTDSRPLLYGMDISPLSAPTTLLTPVAPSMLVYDQDSNNWTGATIQITSHYVNGQDILGFVNELGITGTWVAATGTLTLSGTSSVSNYRTALQSITYRNSSSSPNTTLTRTVTITATDGMLNSDPVTRDLKVITISVPAVLSGVTGTGTYFEDSLPIAIAGGLVISDPNTLDLAGATVTFANWQAEDRTDFNNIFALQHTFSQNLAAHTATFTITGLATVDHYQTLLRSVIYWDVSDSAVTANRTATFTVTDGLSTSNAVVRNIAVGLVNHPVLLSAIETTPLAYKANDPAFPPQQISHTLLLGDPDSNNCSKAVVQISAGYENDANGHDLLSFVNQNGISGSWNAANGTLTLTGISSDSNYRTALRSVMFSTSGSNVSTANRTLTLTATDDFGTPATSLPVTRTVAVTSSNAPPALTGIPASPIAYVRGTATASVSPNGLILDSDSINLSGITIQVTANYQNGQDLLAATVVTGITSSFNATTGTLTLSGVASLASYQTVLQSVTYRTNTGGANTFTRTLTFIANDGLAFSSPISRTVTLS